VFLRKGEREWSRQALARMQTGTAGREPPVLDALEYSYRFLEDYGSINRCLMMGKIGYIALLLEQIFPPKEMAEVVQSG
jgi:hypothetical protein